MCTTPFIVPVTTFVVVETAVSTAVTAVEQLWVKTTNKNNIDKFFKNKKNMYYLAGTVIFILILLVSFL